MTDPEFPELTFEGWLALAEEIGEQIANGDLPPKDENGFYIL